MSILTLSELNSIVWTLTSVSVVITALRLYARAFVVKSVGLDDYLISLGQLVSVGLAAVISWHAPYILAVFDIAMNSNNIFGDDINETLRKSNLMYRSGFVADMIYVVTLPIIKCSILAFYKRIAPSRKQHILLYVIGFLIVTVGFIIFMLGIFSLDPPSAWWNFIYTPGTEIRFNTDHLQIINSSFQVLFDVILLALPLPIIFQTHFNRHDRAGLIFIYILCCFSLIATIVRLVKVTQFSLFDERVEGITNRVEYLYWAVIEIATAITCANIPAMPSFLRYLWRRVKGRSSLPASQTNGGNSRRSAGQSSNKFSSIWSKSFYSNGQKSTLKGSQKSKASISQSELVETKGSVVANALELDFLTRPQRLGYTTTQVTSEAGSVQPDASGDTQCVGRASIDRALGAHAGNRTTDSRRKSSFRMPILSQKLAAQGSSPVTDCSDKVYAGGQTEMVQSPIHGSDRAFLRTDAVDIERGLG